VTDTSQAVMTPTIARFARRSLFWVAITVIVLIIALIGIAVASVGGDTDELAASNPAPNGGQALVEVLRHEGVDVQVAGTLTEAEDAIADPATTTLLLYDRDYFLDEAQTREALQLADTVIVLRPTDEALRVIAPDVALAGYLSGTLEARCDVAAAEVAESLTADGDGYRILEEDAAVGCFADDDVYAMVQATRGGTDYTVLGATGALTNGAILENGNAALALHLLGGTERLVWYIPSTADYETEIATTGELSPPWVIPVILTLFLVGITAIIWRGRRFGPLIVENLPVTVRASETMNGRARLYERGNARLHTLDSLRIGTITRLATLTGLPVLASVDEVIAASAAAAGMDPAGVRVLLVDAHPASDRELVELSDQLLVLEQTVAHRIRPH
jgi:hypothetical protein